MGLFPVWAENIAAHCKKLALEGSIVQIGRQEMFFGAPELHQILARIGNPPSGLVDILEQNGKALMTDQSVTPEYFFAHLGFSQVDSVDISGLRGSQHYS